MVTKTFKLTKVTEGEEASDPPFFFIDEYDRMYYGHTKEPNMCLDGNHDSEIQLVWQNSMGYCPLCKAIEDYKDNHEQLEGSFSIMAVSAEGVKEYAENYELEFDVAVEIAENLANRWEIDYDYDLFMEEGVQQEIDMLIEKGRKGIKKISEDEE